MYAMDEETVRAFVHPGTSKLTPQEIERLAQMAHEAYVKENPYSDIDPSHRKFNDLRADLKASNRQQITYATDILASEGYEMRKVNTPPDQIPIPPELAEEAHLDKASIERMAAKEHGRWNIERFSAGWRKGPKDVANKISPYLVNYRELPDDIKEYDRNAIVNYARFQAQAGYQIIKKEVKE